MRTGETGGFIPRSMEELHERLRDEHPPGDLSLKEDVILWRLPNGVTVWACFDAIATVWTDSRGRKRQLTHWHPPEDEIFSDLLDILGKEEARPVGGPALDYGAGELGQIQRAKKAEI